MLEAVEKMESENQGSSFHFAEAIWLKLMELVILVAGDFKKRDKIANMIANGEAEAVFIVLNVGLNEKIKGVEKRFESQYSTALEIMDADKLLVMADAEFEELQPFLLAKYELDIIIKHVRRLTKRTKPFDVDRKYEKKEGQ